MIAMSQIHLKFMVSPVEPWFQVREPRSIGIVLLPSRIIRLLHDRSAYVDRRPHWVIRVVFDYQTATSALPRTTDISDRPGMSEKCDFRTASDVPKVNLAHPARLAYRLSGQSIGGRNSDTY
jgi:hypothetical protein